MPRPQSGRNHHVHQAGFILHAQKGQARRSTRALAVGNNAGDAHAGAIGNMGKLGSRQDVGKRGTHQLHRLLAMGHAGGSDVGSHKLEGGHARQVRCSQRGSARQHSLALGGGNSGLPQRLTTIQPQTLQCPSRGQRFHLLHAEIRPARKIGHASKRRGRLHALGGGLPQPLNEVEAQPNLARPRCAGLRTRIIDTHRQHPHAVAPGILDERLRGIKAHRLRAQQAHAEFRRVVVLKPRGEIHQ